MRLEGTALVLCFSLVQPKSRNAQNVPTPLSELLSTVFQRHNNADGVGMTIRIQSGDEQLRH